MAGEIIPECRATSVGISNRCAAQGLHVLCRTRKSQRPHAVAEVHKADERLIKEAGEPRRSRQPVRRALHPCRAHEALRITPAMAVRITDHIWSIGELIDAATAEPVEQQAA
jgi:hypothetical protein